MFVLAEIRDVRFSHADGLGRFSAVVGPTGIHNLEHFLSDELAEVFVVQAVRLATSVRVFCSIAALVRDDYVKMAAPPQTAMAPQASNCSQIVRFLAQAALVKFCDRRIHYFGWPESGQ